MAGPKAIIFDIDGTLIDDNDAHVRAWIEAFRSHGYAIPAERIREHIGEGGDHLVPALIGKEAAGRDGKAIRAAHDEAFAAVAAKEHFRVYPKAKELLDRLRGAGLRVALATSSQDHQLQTTERSAGVDVKAWADEVVTSSEAGASKPSPDVVLAALEKLGLPPGECVFVGDTPYDGEAAGRAGVPFVGLLCGGTTDEAALRRAGARAVYRDPAELLERWKEEKSFNHE